MFEKNCWLTHQCCHEEVFHMTRAPMNDCSIKPQWCQRQKTKKLWRTLWSTSSAFCSVALTIFCLSVPWVVLSLQKWLEIICRSNTTDCSWLAPHGSCQRTCHDGDCHTDSLHYRVRDASMLEDCKLFAYVLHSHIASGHSREQMIWLKIAIACSSILFDDYAWKDSTFKQMLSHGRVFPNSGLSCWDQWIDLKHLVIRRYKKGAW